MIRYIYKEPIKTLGDDSMEKRNAIENQMEAETRNAEDVISEVKVLRSAAGFYIGRTYSNEVETGGMDFPYDRLSGYYPKRGDAEKDLPHYLKMV
jgi:hypothetical protein